MGWSCALRDHEIRVYEPFTRNCVAAYDADLPFQHRPSIDECVELAVLSARVSIGRQFRKQRLIELTSGEARINLLRIHAG